MDSHNANRICSSTCDTCSVKGPGVELHHNGTPVLFQCPKCQPHEFERVARQDVDGWLQGGSKAPFGR